MRKLKAMLSWVTVVCLTLIFFSIADFSVSAATVNANVISGETYRLVNVGSGLYLNLSRGNNANGANINQFTGDNSITQDFIIRWIASESCYKIYSACSDEGNDRVLDVKRGGNPITSGCNVQLYSETDPTSQRMQIVSAGATGVFYIQPVSNTSVYLTANDDSTGTPTGTGANSTGNVVMKSAQTNRDYQKWRLVLKNDVPGAGTYYIRNKYSGKYLAVNGTKVVQQTKTGANNQKWTLVSRGNQYYNFKPVSNSTCFMDVENAWDVDGTNVNIHTDQIDGYGAQHFRFEASGDRCYTIRPQFSSTRVLSLPSNTTTQNTQIVIATKNTSLDRQQWYFERVPTDSYAAMNWQYVFANPYTTPYRYLSTFFWEDGHAGMDIIEYGGGVDGATIISPTSGTVCSLGEDDDSGKGAGNFVVIKTNSTDPTTGYQLRVGFYHLKNPPTLTLNQSVSIGTVIGQVGNTGDSTGSHLHLFVTRDNSNTSNSGNNSQANLVDPERFFPYVEFYYHD